MSQNERQKTGKAAYSISIEKNFELHLRRLPLPWNFLFFSKQ